LANANVVYVKSVCKGQRSVISLFVGNRMLQMSLDEFDVRHKLNFFVLAEAVPATAKPIAELL